MGLGIGYSGLGSRDFRSSPSAEWIFGNDVVGPGSHHPASSRYNDQQYQHPPSTATGLGFSRNRSDQGFGVSASERLRDAEILRKAKKKGHGGCDLVEVVNGSGHGSGEAEGSASVSVDSPTPTDPARGRPFSASSTVSSNLSRSMSVDAPCRPPAAGLLASMSRQNSSQSQPQSSERILTPVDVTNMGGGGGADRRKSLLQILPISAQQRVSRALALIEEDISKRDDVSLTGGSPAKTPVKTHRARNVSITRSPAFHDNLATMVEGQDLPPPPPPPLPLPLPAPRTGSPTEELLQYVTPTKTHRKANSSASPVNMTSLQGGYVPGLPRPYTPTRPSSNSNEKSFDQRSHSRSISQPGLGGYSRPSSKLSSVGGSSSMIRAASATSPSAESFLDVLHGGKSNHNYNYNDNDKHKRTVSADTSSIYPSSAGVISPATSAAAHNTTFDFDTTFDPSEYYAEEAAECSRPGSPIYSSASSYHESTVDTLSLVDILLGRATETPAAETPMGDTESYNDISFDEIREVQDRLVQVAKDVRRALLEESRPPTRSVTLRMGPPVRARKPEMSSYDGVSDFVRSLTPTVPQEFAIQNSIVPPLQRNATASSTTSSSLVRSPSSANDHAQRVLTQARNERSLPSTPETSLGDPWRRAEDRKGHEPTVHRRQQSIGSPRLEDDPDIRRNYEARVAQATASLQRNASQSLSRRGAKKGKPMVIGSPKLLESSVQVSTNSIASPQMQQIQQGQQEQQMGQIGPAPGHKRNKSSLAAKSTFPGVRTPEMESGDTMETPSGVKGFMAKLARKPSLLVRKASKRKQPKEAAGMPISSPVADEARFSPRIRQELSRAFDIPQQEPSASKTTSRNRIVRRTIVLSSIPEQLIMASAQHEENQSLLPTRKPSTHRKPVQRTSADQRLEQELSTSPVDTDDKLPKTLQPSRSARSFQLEPVKSRHSGSASLFDLYTEEEDQGTTVPQLLSVFEPKSSGSKAIEIREMEDGQMVWGVVESDSMDKMEQLEDTPQTTPQLGHFEKPPPRPPTQIFYSNSADIAEILEELSKDGMDGRFRILPDPSPKPAEEPQPQSPSTEVSHVRNVENRLQALLERMSTKEEQASI